MKSIDVKKATEYWLTGAEYDLETSKSLMEAKRYPHALFFGHLAIEKILKAIYVKQNKKHAPHTHSLTALAKNSGLSISDLILEKLTKITEYNTEARYPEEKDNLYKKATKEFTDHNFKEIKEVYEWFQSTL